MKRYAFIRQQKTARNVYDKYLHDEGFSINWALDASRLTKIE